MEQLQQERLVVALQVQIEAERMLELTINYVKERIAFGKTHRRFSTYPIQNCRDGDGD